MNDKFIRKAEAGSRPFAPSGIQSLLMDTASLHSDALGYNEDFFIREKKGWAILSMHLETKRLPKLWEPIVIETWPNKGRGLVANRSFRILGADGEPLALALSQWVLFDLERRRPIKIPSDMIEAYSSAHENALNEDKFIIPECDTGKIAEFSITVRRSSTDSNMHVNNVEYVKWAEDNLPEDVYYSKNLKSVRVNYRKEANAGDSLIVSSYEITHGRYAHFVKSAQDAIHAEILMEYR